MPSNKARDERVWQRFILLLSVESFGEKEVIADGKKQVNLYGSVEHHKRIFIQAADQIDIEMEISK